MSVDWIYWDTDAFLGWLQNEKDKANLCAGTIERAEGGECAIFTSALTIAEVLGKFFRRSYIKVRAVTRSIAESAQDVVWNHSIKPKDAIHVATALDVGCPWLETFDLDLIAASGKVGSPPLIIRPPIAPKQPKLL